MSTKLNVRFNSLDSDNEKKKDFSKYFMIAIVLAIVSFFLLTFAYNILSILVKLIIRYWWGAVILLLLIIIIKKKRNRKK